MDDPLIHTFGAMVLAGVLFALWYVRRDAPRVGLDGDDAVSLGVEIFLAGLIGSRILFVYQNWEFFHDKSLFAMLNPRQGGLIWYGGLLSATPMAVLRARAYKLSMPRACDLFAVPVMIGLAVGRIGCLMAGDDHGRIVEEAWYTVKFSNPLALVNDDSFRNVPLLPSQPLMTLGTMTIFIFLGSVRRKLASRPGSISFLLFMLYPIHRFLIEFVRGDIDRGIVSDWIPALKGTLIGGLTTSQGISIPAFAVALIGFVDLASVREQAGEPTPLEAEGVVHRDGSYEPFETAPVNANGYRYRVHEPKLDLSQPKHRALVALGVLAFSAFWIGVFYPGHTGLGVFQTVTVLSTMAWALWDSRAYAHLVRVEDEEGQPVVAATSAPAETSAAPATPGPAETSGPAETPAPDPEHATGSD